MHKGGPGDPLNNGPVSLSIIVCKILEKKIIFCKELSKHMDYIKVLNDGQFGFRDGISSGINMIDLYESLSNNTEERRPDDCIYLDFAKEFDTVPHNTSLGKMRLLLVPQARLTDGLGYIQMKGF